MQLIVAFVLANLAIGINAHQHNHRDVHLHLKGRDAQVNTVVIETVIDTVTAYVTDYIWEDGSPVSTKLPKANVAKESTTTKSAGLFFELQSLSSSTSSRIVAPTFTTSIITSSSVAPAPAPTTTSTSEAVAAPSVAGERTFTIINRHTGPVSTIHDDTVGTPTSAGKAIQPGTIAAGATATFAVQRGWIGNIALNDAKFPITPNSTLLEANFVDWDGVPRADLDVSYVNGFTVPMTCSCNGVVKTGCNLDLVALSSCPFGIVNNACANPLRADRLAVKAASFFAPCQGCAWTFVEDGNADSQCISGPIVCCIGSACPAHPNQGSA